MDSMKSNISDVMKDDGTRVTGNTGAIRELKEGKGRLDLVSPFALMRLALWYEDGAKKYAPRNWEKGMSVEECLNCAERHFLKYKAGMTDEDHLAAVAWNVFAVMHYEHNKNKLEKTNGFNWDFSIRNPDEDPSVERVKKIIE